MKILSTKWFRKWSKKANLHNSDLLETVKNLEDGLSAASLGSNLFKVRVKGENSGKSSGFRTIVIYREGDRAIFLYGFGKSKKENIDSLEQKYFKKLGNDLLVLSESQITELIEKKALFDIGGVK